MFNILLISSAEADGEPYGLEQKFKVTNTNEIKKWFFYGSFTPATNFIRLASLNSEKGGACSYVPTRWLNWVIEMEVKGKGLTEGENIGFVYSTDFCEKDLSKFHGLGFFINISHKYQNGSSPAYLFTNDGSPVTLEDKEPTFSIYLHTRAETFLRIKRNENGVSFEQLNDYYSSLKKFKVTDVILPETGYFSFFAQAGKNEAAIDLNAFRVFPEGEEEIEPPKNIEEVNKKLFSKSSFHKESKEKRRLAMQSVQSYIKKINESNAVLTDNKENFNDVKKIILEIAERASQTMTLTDLNLYIKMMDTKLKKAAMKSDIVSKIIDETRIEINSSISRLRINLNEIREEANRQLSQISKDAIQEVNAVKINSAHIPRDKVTFHRKKATTISYILFFICLIEIISYITFLNIRRRKTKNFKKYD